MSLGPGSTVGRYRLEARLGEGGMGVVYRAFDPQLQRAVAVKLLPREKLSPQAIQRFEREARAVAQLSHPNIVVLHDFGSEEGTPFLVTELLVGEPLSARLGRGAIAWPESVALATLAAEGLTAAHARGIVHRDLKPSNLFLVDRRQLKLLDFGIARLDEPTGGDEVALTQTGGLVGSPGFMSPEQASGQALDARSDLFSLGAVLYEMLSGRAAFAGTTPAARLVAILRDEPPPLAASVPELPAELVALVARLLDKEPARRPASAAEVASALARIAALPPTLAIASTATSATTLPRSLLAAEIELRASNATVASGPYPQVSAAGDPRRIAVLPIAGPESESELDFLADGLTEGLIRNLSRLPRRSVLAASTVFRFRGATDPLAAGRELGADAVLVGRLQPAGAGLRVSLELVDVASGEHLWGESWRRTADELVDLDRQVARALAQRLDPEASSGARRRLDEPLAVDPEAHRDYLRGRAHWNRRSPEGLEASRQAFRRALDRDPAFALAWAGLADSWNVAPFWGLAAPTVAFPRAREAAERALALEPDLAEAHAALGYLRFYFDWSWARAERDFQRALAENRSDAATHHRRGIALALLGQPAESRRELERAERLDPLSLILRADRGLAEWLGGAPEAAVGRLRALVDAEPDFAPAQLYLGLALETVGELAEAAHALEAAGERSAAIAARAGVAAKRGDLAAARRALAEIEGRRATRYVSDYPVALLELALGEREAALATLERALAARCETLVWALRDPRLAPLRSEPRLAALIAEMGDLGGV